MNKKILASITSLLFVGTLITGASFAEFSSSAKSTSNTFTAGTLKVALAASGATATGSSAWISPINWAPGQTVSGSINLKNEGNVNANHVWFDFSDITHAGNGYWGDANADIRDAIYVTGVYETFNGIETANQLATLAGQVGSDGKITLKQLEATQYYSVDDKSGDGTILKGGEAASDYSIRFDFQLDPNAGNTYQAATTGFTFNCRATQNSDTTGYVAIHPVK